MSNILITGIAGLVGSNIAKDLVNDHNVIGLDNLVGGYRDNIPDKSIFIEQNCDSVSSDIFEGVDTVIHAACTAHEGLSVFSPYTISHNTFDISNNILKCAIQAGVKKFIFMSSMARYGQQSVLPFTEEMKPKPQDPYGISKYAFEEILKIMSEVHGIEYTIMIPHNIIGPGQNYTDPFRNVAGIMINRMLQGKQPIIYGDGTQKRCFSDIREVVSPIKKVIFTDIANGETINIGPDSNFITINELSELIAEVIGFDLDPIYMPGRPKEVRFANCSADKARRLLDYDPVIPLKETIQSMVDWVSNRGTDKFNYNLPVEIVNELTPKTWTSDLFNN